MLQVAFDHEESFFDNPKAEKHVSNEFLKFEHQKHIILQNISKFCPKLKYIFSRWVRIWSPFCLKPSKMNVLNIPIFIF